MLKDCLDIFRGLYEQQGDNLILKDYKLTQGDYILINDNGEIIKKMTVNNKNDYNIEDYNYFKELDYLSKLISMQKPIDSKKVIHSNSHLSFFVRKENINNGKLSQEIIDNYYKMLNNAELKYKTKDKRGALLIYKELEKQYGKTDSNSINKNKQWIKENIFSLLKKLTLKEDNNYLKIFFNASIEDYRKESEKYIFPNVFNNVEHNVDIEGNIYGVSGNNTTLNSKKPFLLNKTRKNTMPYLIELEEAALQQKFFEFLLNKIEDGRNIIYLSDKKQFYLKNDEVLKEKFNGLFLRIEKGLEPKIMDFTVIPNYNPKINSIEIDGKVVENKSELLDLIDDVYFGKQLKKNLFREANDMNISNWKFKAVILRYKEVFIDYFYRGNELLLKNMWHKISKEIIKLSISNGYILNARQQENLQSILFK
ncbi:MULTISPECIES: CRISPR-associated protein Cse4 [unclassified Clostridium]|uniref:CRISPR-associated protein Cse4 n=1 Tax=unclassified Clostridium TaxID=2614128 RepID=UPI0025C5A445|nr:MULTISPECIES: CRISPR-associated protein Cse4 [unclassified Clostridium]